MFHFAPPLSAMFVQQYKIGGRVLPMYCIPPIANPVLFAKVSDFACSNVSKDGGGAGGGETDLVRSGQIYLIGSRIDFASFRRVIAAFGFHGRLRLYTLDGVLSSIVRRDIIGGMKKIILAGLVLASLAGCYYTGGDPIGKNANTTDKSGVTIGIVWPWEPKEVYSTGDMVTVPPYVRGGPIYLSLLDGNENHSPPDGMTPIHTNPVDPDWASWWMYYGPQN